MYDDNCHIFCVCSDSVHYGYVVKQSCSLLVTDSLKTSFQDCTRNPINVPSIKPLESSLKLCRLVIHELLVSHHSQWFLPIPLCPLFHCSYSVPRNVCVSAFSLCLHKMGHRVLRGTGSGREKGVWL